MIDFKKDWIKVLTFILLLIGSLSLVYIQIEKAQTATKLESALVSAIQFLLSVGFTWLLAMVVFENSQKEKQKKFAIAAFRRIKEIERNIIRTHNYISNSLNVGDDSSGCLRVVQSNLLNVQDTIRSSIYDWADVIEDEIELAQEIEKLEIKKTYSMDESIIAPAEQKKAEKQIDTLSKRLPPALRQSLKILKDRAELTNKAAAYLEQKLIKNGHIELNAFWELKDSFMREPVTLINGDEVYVARGITENRGGAIIVYDKEGNSIGVVTNGCSELEVDYDIFAGAMAKVFGKQIMPKLFGGKPILAKVSKVEDFDKGSGRKYFDILIQKSATHQIANE